MNTTLPVSDELLEQEYCEWFKDEFGFTPVITTSSGRPAVQFAKYVFQKYANGTEQPAAVAEGGEA